MPKTKKAVAARSNSGTSSTRTVRNPGMIMLATFLILTVITALVIYLANMWFPEHVVLGTMSISMTWAIVLSSAAVGLIGTFTLPFLTEVELQQRRELTSMEMMGVYLVINFVALWLVSRVAEIFGLGFSSWMVVLAMAIVLDIAQGIGMVAFQKTRMK